MKRAAERKTEPGPFGSVIPEKGFRVLRVIYNETVDPVTVVTVYFDDEASDL